MQGEKTTVDTPSIEVSTRPQTAVGQLTDSALQLALEQPTQLSDLVAERVADVLQAAPHRPRQPTC
jgi:hypothetical protein